MRNFGKWLGRVLLALALLAGAAWYFGPYEPVEVAVSFDERKFGEGVQVYLESVEAAFDDLTPGTEKRVIWAGERETRTPVALLYVHGFSATSEELRPVPDRVAEALGANLVFTRLTGHGRGGAALAQASVRDWMGDVAEALAVARAVGEEVIVMSTSTGGTLVAEAALQPELVRGVKGMIFVSPNFGLKNPAAPLLTLPGARYVIPLLAGRERSWQAANEEHEKYWTTRYPTVAAVTLAALVKHAAAQDYSGVGIPALFYFSPEDEVVRAEATERIAAEWGGAARVVLLPPEAEVDPERHVIAGDIRSPKNTDAAVALMLEWIGGL